MLLNCRAFLSSSLVLFTAACAAAPPPPLVRGQRSSIESVDAKPPAALPEVMGADTKITTASKATFTVSKGWYVTRTEDRIVIEDPERSVRMYYLDLEDAAAASALARGWKLVDPTFARKERDAVSLPAHDGWDEITQTVYASRDDEDRIAIAVALRVAGHSEPEESAIIGAGVRSNDRREIRRRVWASSACLS